MTHTLLFIRLEKTTYKLELKTHRVLEICLLFIDTSGTMGYLIIFLSLLIFSTGLIYQNEVKPFTYV